MNDDAQTFTAWGVGVDYVTEDDLRRGIDNDDIFMYVNGSHSFKCPPSHLPPNVKVVYKYRRHTRSVLI